MNQDILGVGSTYWGNTAIILVFSAFLVFLTDGGSSCLPRGTTSTKRSMSLGPQRRYFTSAMTFIWGDYGTQYRVRLYPPLRYSVLYKEYDITRFNHLKNTTQVR